MSALARIGLGAIVVFGAACTPEQISVSPGDAGVPIDAATDADGADADDADDTARCVPGGTMALEAFTIACAQGAPARIGLDEKNAYWTVQKSNAIVMKTRLQGGPVETLVYGDVAAVGLAVGVRYIFYTQPAAGRVMRVPKAGGQAVALATKLDAPLFLTIDLDSAEPALYWTGGTGSNGVVMRLGLADGAKPVVLIDGQPRPRAIAVHDGFVYWTDFVDGALLRIPAAEPPDGGVGTATRLASGLLGPSDLALADGFAYLPDQAGRLTRVPLAGGALETVATVPGVPFGVATNGVALYWTTLGSDGGIFRMRFGGDGHVDTIAAGELEPHFLAVGDVAVFWGAWGAGGTIRKTAR